MKYFALPPLIIWIGLHAKRLLVTFVEKAGDMSYGIYIYSFPVQQTLMHFFDLGTFELMMASIIVSGIFGYLSWHWIEKRFLKYKALLVPENKFVEH